MLKSREEIEYENVYGITYERAKAQMEAVEQSVLAKDCKGFVSEEQCRNFAHDIHADIAVFHKATGVYRFVNHTGDMLVKASWCDYYRSILYWTYENEKGIMVPEYYAPSDYKALRNARIAGEIGDGKHEPLYTRNYFVPTGYYDESTGTFNDAQPFSVFAAPTGNDTSHIYELLRHISGDCYPYVLAWLRTKLVNPTAKAEVIPIFVGEQGAGKSSFGEAVCTALFGVDNVLVSYQFDVQARFNADTVNKLIICLEEKGEQDKKNTAAAIKSASTAKRVRREHKGLDPFDQESYTDYVMTTNEMVPLKFEDSGKQRRFMVMEVDREFTREKSKLADEIFTKLYGEDKHNNKVGLSLVEDLKTIAQFKHELYNKKDCEGVSYRDFPVTDAYKRCFSIPRTNEAMHIEALVRSLVPFIKAALISGSIQKKVNVVDEEDNAVELSLDQVVLDTGAMQYVNAWGHLPMRVALCEPAIFVDKDYKPYAHSVVQKILLNMRPWLEQEGIELRNESVPPKGGFKHVNSSLKNGNAIWFSLADVVRKPDPASATPTIALTYNNTTQSERIGQRVRYSKLYADNNGEYETLNELKPGCEKQRCSANAQYMDTFLLEADDAPAAIVAVEQHLLESVPEGGEIDAEKLYAQRLEIQDKEAERLFNAGIVARIVYSGGKSMHMLVRVKYEPKTKQERDWLHFYLTATLSDKLTFDQSTKDPARLTRAPYTITRRTEKQGRIIVGTQRLLKEDWSHVWTVDWRMIYEAWKNIPASPYESRGKMLPSKPVYKEAAQALLNGTFFTSIQFSGIRQETFFPAYRLIRSMGYTHDEIWTELDKDIENYPKANERNYWHTRKDGDLIRSIDAEFDEC